MKFSSAVVLAMLVVATRAAQDEDESERTLLRSSGFVSGSWNGFPTGTNGPVTNGNKGDSCAETEKYDFAFSISIGEALPCFKKDAFCMEHVHSVAGTISGVVGVDVNTISLAASESNTFCGITSKALSYVTGFIDVSASVDACRFGNGIGPVKKIDMTTNINHASIAFTKSYAEANTEAYAEVATGSAAKASACNKIAGNLRKKCSNAYSLAQSAGIAMAGSVGQSASLAVAGSGGEMSQSLSVEAQGINKVRALIGAAVGNFAYATSQATAVAAASATAEAYTRAITETCSVPSPPKLCLYIGSKTAAVAKAIADSAAFADAFASAIGHLYVEANVAAKFGFGMVGGRHSVDIVESAKGPSTLVASMCLNTEEE